MQASVCPEPAVRISHRKKEGRWKKHKILYDKKKKKKDAEWWLNWGLSFAFASSISVVNGYCNYKETTEKQGII